MAADAEAELLERYRDELLFLRRMGVKFARAYPRIARRLELGDGPCPDPHVERLLEGVAFLTARIQHNLEGELPEITAGLLGYLYPHFVSPVPSMAIARLSPADDGAGMTSGLDVPRHTKLFVETSFQARTCRFRTAYPVTLWPLKVEEVRMESTNAYDFLTGRGYGNVQSVLRVKLRSLAAPISKLAPEKLRFHLYGEQSTTGLLYELLTCNLLHAVCLPDGRKPIRGQNPKPATVRPVGFEADEDVLPTPPHGLRGYTLLQEYFAFPEKYLFVDVEGLTTDEAEETLDLLFLITTTPRRRLSLSADAFQLGCTPIINLFEKVSEPVQLDHRRFQYKVTPDARWERTTEIHSVRGVTDSLSLEGEGLVIAPLYSLTHPATEEVVYWDARRRPSGSPDIPGTDLWMSFVDEGLEHRLPPVRTLRVHALCTNRDLPTHMDQGERLYVEEGPHCVVECLTRPTAQLTPPMQGETLWRLISHLALNHLSLPDGEGATEALREQLRLYEFTSPISIEPQILSIQQVRRETVALRADQGAWRGFCRVQRITMRVDEERFAGFTPVLLGYVLHHFFGLHASVNVFTQLALESRQREGTWKRWPPMIPSTRE
jgi:type VI secretion system protein ImpG